jgi:hypothetical protein
MFRNFLQSIYPFQTTSSSFEVFRWIIAVLIVGVYLSAGTCFVSTPVCFLLLGKKRMENLAANLDKQTGRCLLSGVGLIVLIYILILALSLIATPGKVLGVVFSVLLWVAVVVGYAGVAVWIISKARGEPTTLPWVILGAVLITMLQVIPIVGIFFVAWFALLASGAVAVTAFNSGHLTARHANNCDSPETQRPTKTDN